MGFDDFHRDMLIRLASAGTKLQAIADFSFQLGKCFVARPAARLDRANLAAVVPGQPSAVGLAREGAGETHVLT